MPNQSRAGVEAFIDRGFPDSRAFCTHFLQSPEFSSNTLKTLVKNGKSQLKSDLATSLAAALESQSIDPEDVMRAFVQQPRKWLSFKLGHCAEYPTLKTANKLLTEFGEEGWYGPVRDQDSSLSWYIRTHSVPFYEHTYQAVEVTEDGIAKQASPVAKYNIRWTVIAQISPKHVALSWNGFRYNDLLKNSLFDPHIESLIQFPYWNHIPKFFEELTQQCKASWEYPVLHKIVLQNLWDRYVTNPQYIWQHLRIRADNRGVALNAHSTGAFNQEQQQIRGLQALSKQLAYSALNSLNIEAIPKYVSSVESSLLRTLIQEWGTKSYEFSLDRMHTDDNKQSNLFRAHCYFANGPSVSPQDSLQHLHCFINKYGGSSQALSFLLSELEG